MSIASMFRIAFPVAIIATVVLVGLKLSGVMEYSWLVATLPAWVTLASCIVVIGLCAIYVVLEDLWKRIGK